MALCQDDLESRNGTQGRQRGASAEGWPREEAREGAEASEKPPYLWNPPLRRPLLKEAGE
jgi:hypothetical protein